jgi:hypothetical protein
LKPGNQIENSGRPDNMRQFFPGYIHHGGLALPPLAKPFA